LEANQVRARLHDDAMAEAFRKDPAYAVELLHSILEDGDQGELLIALRQMTKAAGREMLTPFDPAKWLTSAEAVAAFLADAEATADPAYVEHAREVAARARAMHGLEG
jgi:DNA-binding phage protein